MKRTVRNLDFEGKATTGGGGSGYARTPSGLREGSSMAKQENRMANQIRQSVEDRGGFPTRGGKPLKTKMQERAERRQTEAQATREYAKGRQPFKFK